MTSYAIDVEIIEKVALENGPDVTTGTQFSLWSRIRYVLGDFWCYMREILEARTEMEAMAV